MNDFKYVNHFYDNDHVNSQLIIGNDSQGQDPLVSVIMPVYNHPDFFKKSLLSVINQKCDFEYEIIIVDNGHPDFQPKNQEIIEKLYSKNIRYYVNEKNIGGVGSENRGVQLAKGKYITFCHDDDMLYDDALETLVRFSTSINDSKAAIFGRFVSIDERDNVMTKYTEWDSLFLKNKKSYKVQLTDFLIQNYTNGCGSLYSRLCYIEIGGFCEDFIPVPDCALNAKYTSLYGAYAINKLTLKYRVSSQSDTGKVYPEMIQANKYIRQMIMENNDIPWFFPKFYVGLNLKTFELNLYSKWDDKKPSYFKSLLYKICNRLVLYYIYTLRSLR